MKGSPMIKHQISGLLHPVMTVAALMKEKTSGALFHYRYYKFHADIY